MARSAKLLTKLDANNFVTEWREVRKATIAEHTTDGELLNLYRKTFFRHFLLSDKVPENLVSVFVRFAENFYDKASTGYAGIMAEIDDRVSLYSAIDGTVEIREFLKHADGQTDIYDKDEKISYEKKTGCGDWLRSEKAHSFEEVIAEYSRKRTLIRWDYEFTPDSATMDGKKSVKKTLPEEEKETLQEKKKKADHETLVPNKQYAICIHIETTYKKLFAYMATYDGGLKTFFKESKRSGVAGVRCWQMQTIKNSKKKIAFLEACPYNEKAKK